MELNKKIKVWTLVFWLAVWQVVSMLIHQEILLVSPFDVVKRIFYLVQETMFYRAVLGSLFHVLLGFVLALIVALLLAVLSFRRKWIEDLLRPFVFTIKSIPVASFIILVLVWVSSRQVSVVISFLMVFPILYENILTGIQATNKELLEMAELFQLSPIKKLRFVYFSEVLPYFQSACSLSLGMCWKSGIAAEVIGLPKYSIGEHLYQAKIYFDTIDLFAWTVVIIICSILFEKVFMYLLNCLVAYVHTEV